MDSEHKLLAVVAVAFVAMMAAIAWAGAYADAHHPQCTEAKP